ncbi:MAG TPA: hypothetical protein VFS97_03770 [Nitrososphaeraceae archaeon]|nr:hypothetical protein [Nitrososphaeraceae archaeon]
MNYPMERNNKLTIASAMAMVSVLALSIFISPTFILPAKAQDQNQTSQATGPEAMQKLKALAEKVRQLATSAGFNGTLPQGGDLANKLSALNQSGALTKIREQLPQALSQLGINTTNIKDLQQERGGNLQSLIQKLQNLTASHGT